MKNQKSKSNFAKLSLGVSILTLIGISNATAQTDLTCDPNETEYCLIEAEGPEADFLLDTNEEILNGVEVDTQVQRLTIENRGKINGTVDSYRAISVDQYGPKDTNGDSTDTERFSFINSGSMNGDAILGTSALNSIITNSGSISMQSVTRPFDPYDYNMEAMEVEVETIATHSINFLNSGRILQNNAGSTALSFETDSETGSVITIVNSGEISTDGGSKFIPAEFLDFENEDRFTSSVGLHVSVDAPDAVLKIENKESGIISATGYLKSRTPDGDTLVFRFPEGGGYSIGIATKISGTVEIINEGTIRGDLTFVVPTTSNLANIDIENIEGRIIGGAITSVGASNDVLINKATGIITGGIALGAGDDRIENFGIILNNLYLGSGDDYFLHSLNAVFNGTVDFGDGTDTLAFDLTGTNGLITDELLAKFVNWEIRTIVGGGDLVTEKEVAIAAGGSLDLGQNSVINTPGAIAVSGGAADESLNNAGSITGNIDLGGGDNRFENTGSVTGSVTTGSGKDTFVNNGLIDGDIDMGAGNDTLALGPNALITGTIKGGTGVDTLAFSSDGTESAYAEVDGESFIDFEQFENVEGVTAISGNLALGTDGEITVTGGRLIGLAGSVMTGAVTVDAGATFGSAGTVNGNINIAGGGSLSPGASPGIMVVNGNVVLSTGSTTNFEFVPSPGQGDQLIINGSLNIASGTTLELSGSRPLTPGVAYDLITATDGITGTFTNVNKASSVVGFLRYTRTQLQLLGTFVAPTGVSAQTEDAIDYVNSVLVSGTASAGLLSAIPSLVNSDGTANAKAFGQLTAESYASASQLSVEHGLALAKTARGGMNGAVGEEAGPFIFGNLVGNWRDLKGDTALGTSSAKSESFGYLGGIGYGNQTLSIGAFVGKLDSKQTIRGLNARTDADGIVAGVISRFVGGGLDLNLLLAYDWSDAVTARAVPDGTARSKYNLRALTLDVAAGYSVPVSDSWAVRPAIGVTHIATNRQTTLEGGSAAFSYAVMGGFPGATFVDASMTLKGGLGAGDTVRPWLQAGLRHLVDGSTFGATGGLPGTTGFSVLGASREKTLPNAGAGIEARLDNLTLYGAYLGEFGKTASHSVTVGVRFGF